MSMFKETPIGMINLQMRNNVQRNKVELIPCVSTNMPCKLNKSNT